MKLLLFILGISLCAALPSLRGLQNPNDIVEAPAEDLSRPVNVELIPQGNEDDGVTSGYIFNEIAPSEEEDFGQESSEENIFPSEEEVFPEEEEKNLLEDIKGDEDLNDLFEFGVDNVINAGIKKNKIPNAEFTVTSVFDYSMTADSTEEAHSFNCEAVSENEASVINMNFTVKYMFRNRKTTVASYSFMVKTTTVTPVAPTEDRYIELRPAQIMTNEEVQTVLNYGIDQVVEKGNQKGKIPVSDYNLTKVVSVERMRKGSKNYYKCSVELEDENQVLVKAQFVASINLATQEMFLSTYSYQVSNVKFSIDESAYTEVNKAEVETNAQIKACLDLAIKEAVKEARQYTKVDVNSVYTQVLKGTVYYKFDVELSNNKDKSVQLITTVAYKPETSAMDVKAYETKTTTVSSKK